MPVPVPIDTFVSATVGLAVNAYTIPFSVTLAPPSAVILPPRVTEVVLTCTAALVVAVGEETEKQLNIY